MTNLPNGTTLLIWGHGASQLDAIREAESDANFLDERSGSSLERAGYAERDEETSGWVLLDDAWCVAIDPALVSTDDLDHDPAVIGYVECETGC